MVAFGAVIIILQAFAPEKPTKPAKPVLVQAAHAGGD
jgi:hypothetical protein